MDRTHTNSRPSGAWRRIARAGVMAVGVLGLGACSLDVENPSNIEDADLNNPDAISAMVAGVAYDFAYAMTVPGGGGLVTAGAMLTDELVHVGTWVGLRGPSDGLKSGEWVESQSRWGEPSQARWTAEQAITRISDILTEDGKDPASSADVAQVTMWAGHANRVMGDHFCAAVIDGGPKEDYTVYYDRAEGYLEDAVSVAQAAGEEDLELASIAGLAHVNMMQGDWDAAKAYAEQVPTEFVYEIHYRDGGVENDLFWWGYERDETSVWGTPFADWGLNKSDENSTGDPRVSYDIAMDDEGNVLKGGDNRRPFYRQLKYGSYGDEIPLVKGTEMRLIEAEFELVKNQDIGAAVALINEVRTFQSLPAIDPNTIADLDAAWELLMKERGLELWLEGKRLADIRRWLKAEPGWFPFTVVREAVSGEPATADPKRTMTDTPVWQEANDICFAISKNEVDSNPNF